MELANILENKELGKIYGLIGNITPISNNDNYQVITDYKFSGTVRDYLKSPKALDSLKMVMLPEDILDKTALELSEVELKKVNLGFSLIANKEVIILDYFEKGLNNKEKENFKRLFKKISDRYHKTIVIFTNDITFIWDLATTLIIVDKNQVINSVPKSQIFDIIDYLDKPEIVKFIDLMRKKGLKVDNYKNVLDLLKAIYRIKGE